ncbi:MAG: 30S ribosomal protein S12 methylthiotransferase RimO [Caldiserica bacterium]|nr:30S ribosomal protein S12 methylthiotransferase RimO [Caldisericota bacterium]
MVHQRINRRPRVCVVSLGCAKNLADSEAMLGQIVAAEPAAVVCAEPQDADVVVVNTCGFLKAARDEADEVLAAIERLRVDGHVGRIVAVGCYPQLWKAQVLRRHPGLYDVMGVSAMYQTAFWKSLLKEVPLSRIEQPVDPDTMRGFEAPRLLSGSGSYAYLKIADGCSQRCTYCTIPQIKGPLVSRSEDAILREAEQLIRAGATEIILVSQNTSAYGVDLTTEHRPQLAALLRKMDRLSGMRILRVLYLYPTLVSEELLEVIGGSSHIAHYVDIPLQHTDPVLLKAMGRPWAAGSAGRVVERVRRIIPDAAIRSTFIVGFPGETEEQFKRLLDDLRTLRLDHASAFAYSREALAVSSGFPNQVHASTKGRRLREFMEVQQGISASVNDVRYLGKDIEVIVDGMTQSTVYGRTLLDAPDVDNAVLLRTGHRTRPAPGDICRAHITAVGPYDLDGDLV